MFRSFLLLFNLLAFSLWRLLFPAAVSVSQTVPSSVQANNSFMVQVAINKADVKGIAKFTEQLPVGLTAVPIDNDGARASFTNNMIEFSWDSLPAEGIINISFRVDVSSSAVSGRDTLIGRFAYAADGQKAEADCAPSYIDVSGTAIVAGSNSRQIDSIKMCSGGIFVVRRFPAPSIPPNTSAKITLILHKANIKGFAKIEDSLPPGFTASAMEANGASFTFVNSIAKFVWQDIPADSVITISYQVMAGSDVSGTHAISGNFSYIYNGGPYTCSIGSTIFNTTLLNNIANAASNNAVPSAAPPVVAANSQPVTEGNNNQPEANSTPSAAPPQTEANSQQSENENVTPSIPSAETGISYRVQIMALHKPVDVSYFSLKRRINLYVRTELDGGFTKYTIGHYTDYKQVRDEREEMRNRGIKGPFVVSYNSGVRITVQEALMITHQQWYK